MYCFNIKSLFVTTFISQGSAATQLRCGVVCNVINTLMQIYCQIQQWKNFENQLIFAKVIGKSIEVPFLTHRDGSMQYICHFSAQSMSGDIKLHIIHCFSLQYEGRHKDSW